MAVCIGTSLASCSTERDDGWNSSLEPKHKVFLSHSGAQKPFVEHLCMELEGRFIFPFFDKRHESLPIGENFPRHIFAAIQQCYVGVVILSEEFFMSKWPMMELVAMVEEVEKRKFSFKIIPVFFGTSLKEFDDPITRIRWESRWHELASLNKNRVEVEKWKASIKYLRGINGLIYDGLDEVRFERMVVDAICEVVPAEIRLEDSHIKGRSRICKKIQDKISELQEDMVHEVCVMGLYGMGGIGKTSICKALCNEFRTRFRGKVCHAELERMSKEELLRDVVKRLSNASHERLDRFNNDELENALKGGVVREAIFLALDNMSDTDSSISEAKTYLSARLPPGSIVMVTARSKASLLRVRPYISEKNCMEMPELEIEEAKSLFVQSSSFEVRNEGDEHLMLRCVERCRFLKGSDVEQYHYHPLALDVLGRQFGYIDSNEWNAQLDKLDDDIFNQSKENDHPIFSILRKSFDALSLEDQVLFMDIVLYLPCKSYYDDDNAMEFEWLGMMHGLRSIEDILVALQRLKRKSLLEEVGDGKKMRIGMHDLWRAFSIAETKYGKRKRRRWVYENRVCYGLSGQNACKSDMLETNSLCWKHVSRMGFEECEAKNVKRVNFAYFPNVVVLKINSIIDDEELVIDLAGLCHLKSLELSRMNTKRIVVCNMPKGLEFICSSNPYYYSEARQLRFRSEEFINQIGCIKKLQHLDLSSYSGGKLPDMNSMVSLRVGKFRDCTNVVTLIGLGSQLGQLRVLDLNDCWKLRGCPGIGDLKVLEKLNLSGCCQLERLPDLRKLTKLRSLVISWCLHIEELPGLDELVALEELSAEGCWELQKLPNLHKLKKLQVLNLSGCPLEAVFGFDNLYSLEEVKINFYNVVDKPLLQHLTKVQSLVITGWSLRELRDVPNLVMLKTLGIDTCCGVEELPHMQSLIQLQSLEFRNCDFKDVHALEKLSMLNRLCIGYCKELERLPDLKRLSRLESLVIEDCPMVEGWGCTLGVGEGTSCMMDDTSDQFAEPDYEMVTNLQQRTLSNCGLVDLSGIGAFSELDALEIDSLPTEELPDSSVFRGLRTPRFTNCGNLRGLESCSPMTALLTLSIRDCKSLAMVLDLCMFPVLEDLELSKCPGISILRCSGPLHALRCFRIMNCSGVKELPDMGMFPGLREVSVRSMTALTGLRCSRPLTAMRRLDVVDCCGLREVLDLRMFPAMERMTLGKQSTSTTWSGVASVPTSGEVEGSSTVLDQSNPPHSLGVGECLITLWDCGFTNLRGIGVFSGLTILTISSLRVMDVLDLSNFPRLQILTLSQCERLTGLMSCEPLIALKRLNIDDCESLETLPDPSKCPELCELALKNCHCLTSLSGTGSKFPTLTELSVEDCSTGLEEAFDWEISPVLEIVCLTGYRGVQLFKNLEFLTELCELQISRCMNLTTLPDLCAFPQLRRLELSECHGIITVSSTGPSTKLESLNINDCRGLQELPDLGLFPILEIVTVKNLGRLTTLSSTGPLTKLEYLIIIDCCGLQELPDLGLFPILGEVVVMSLGSLTMLSSNMPMSALRKIHVEECGRLSAEHLDQLRALAAPHCELEYIPLHAIVDQISQDSATSRQATLCSEDVGCISWLSSCLFGYFRQ